MQKQGGGVECFSVKAFDTPIWVSGKKSYTNQSYKNISVC